MTLNDQKLLFFQIVDEITSIQLSKGGDYANTDRLSNFKLAGEITGVGAELNCLNMIATKVARLGVLLNSKEQPNNESIDDTMLDLISYSILLKMIRTELNQTK